MMDSRYLFEETVTAIMTENLHRLARNQQAEAPTAADKRVRPRHETHGRTATSA
jgi:hypothetical protein